ncbi:chitinase-3-like protein 1 [Pristis pectinata]|uniref:chitinase-3-like protein 1 n=1 Tax=Pristis pectinata TaxID=685728 RepID=UPI00223CC552|nr:chitinase-3-like protein 1 [Pristis pectinata]
MGMIFELLGSTYLLACYFSNWAQYRSGFARYLPEEINPFLCTHLIYAFAAINEDNKIVTTENNDEAFYKSFNDLKKRNKKLKTLLAVGGWRFGSTRFNSMVTTQTTRAIFINSVVSFLRHHRFDGLELTWQYPGAEGNPPENKELYSRLVKELKTTFIIEAKQARKPTLLLSASVAAGKHNIDGSYDVPLIAKHLDFIGVMTFDFNGPWNTFTGHNSPLYPRGDEVGDSMYYNTEFAVKYLRGKGVPGRKLLVGIATYGRSFNLSTSNSDVGAPITGPGPAAEFTKEPGIMANFEICDFLKGAEYFWIDEQQVPYAVKGDTWLGYDNLRSINSKVKWLKKREFGGVFVWTLDFDDLHGHCQRGPHPNQRSQQTRSLLIILDHSIKNAYCTIPRPHFGKSNHLAVLLFPTSGQRLRIAAPVVTTAEVWSREVEERLQDYFESMD